MLKIFTTSQTKACDAFTIQEEKIDSIDLMERACKAFTVWFTERYDVTQTIGVVCGTGNNGGDGLGIARILSSWGYAVNVWIVKGSNSISADFKINFERLKETKVNVAEITAPENIRDFDKVNILIDAVFGSGLSRPVEGLYAEVIHRINQSDVVCIAVDVPSGLSADGASGPVVVSAYFTVTFQLPKLSFLLPQYHTYVGQWFLLDIGLSKNFIKNEAAHYFYISKNGVKKLFKERSRFDHKGTFGHALIVAGSLGKMGAAVLTAKATLRSGAGLLTVHTAGCGYNILQTAVPEAMASVDENTNVLSVVPDLSKIDTVGVGPGIGQQKETVNALRILLETFKKPIVIDADALNILSQNRELLHLIPQESILTPHPKEFERLVGNWSDDFERLEKQKNLAIKLHAVIVLKGAYTSIATPQGDIFFNSTGNPGMATGGTGDVLTGILTGLLAQGYAAKDAAIMGVYLHGLAGDLAAWENGMESLIASDLIKFLPHAFKNLKR